MNIKTTLTTLITQLKFDKVEILTIDTNDFGVNALLNVNDEKQVELDIEAADGQYRVIQTEGEAAYQFIADELEEVIEEVGLA